MPGHDQSRRCYTLLQRFHGEKYTLWWIQSYHLRIINSTTENIKFKEKLPSVQLHNLLSCLCLYPLDYFHLQSALLLWAWAMRGQSKSISLPCRCWSACSYWGTSLRSPARLGPPQWPHSRCSEGSRRAWRAESCQWAGCPPGTWKSSDKNRQVSQFSFLPLTQNM